MTEQIEILPPVVGTDLNSVPTTSNKGTEIHRSKRLRGSISFSGDAHLAMLATAIAALGEEATRLENLPDAPWFRDYRACLESLGASFEQLENHWLVRGPVGTTRPSTVLRNHGLPLQVHHDLEALILSGISSGLGLNLQLNLHPIHVSDDVRALLTQIAQAKRLPRRGDDGLAKIPLLFHHLAAGEGLELHLRRLGSDLLENLLKQFEIPVKVERDDDKDADEFTRRQARLMRAANKEELLTRIKLPALSKPKAAFVSLPGDVGEASLVALAATLIKGSDVLLEGVLLNAGRSGFFKALRRMGADIEVVQRKERFGETFGTLRVRSSGLFAKRFDVDSLSDLRDEVFLLLTAAAFAEGESVFRDLDYLRHGPVDLLKVFIGTLKQTGIEIGEFEDGLIIRGREEYDGGKYDAMGHPGLAAAYAVLSLKSHGASDLIGSEALDYRFPGVLARIEELTASEKTADKPTEKSPEKTA